MSVTSKVFLGASCITALSIIGYVHYKQQLDRERLHEGVILDIERQQRRKMENVYNLEKQASLTKELRKLKETPNS